MNPSNILVSELRRVALGLFGPSDECLLQVAREGTPYCQTLPPDLQSLLGSEAMRTRIEVMREGLAWAADEVGNDEAFRLCVESATTPRMLVEPELPFAAGQCRLVVGVDLNNPASPTRYTPPLVVLLDALDVDSAEGQPAAAVRIWRGWAVMPFAAFAGTSDLLLQGDDVPNSCVMVQAWNRVTVAEPHLGGLEYCVSDEALRQVRAVWFEYLADETPQTTEDIGDALGFVGTRIAAGGVEVVTGNLDSNPMDPRAAFRRMAAKAGDSVNHAARALVQAAVQCRAAEEARASATDVLAAAGRLAVAVAGEATRRVRRVLLQEGFQNFNGVVSASAGAVSSRPPNGRRKVATTEPVLLLRWQENGEEDDEQFTLQEQGEEVVLNCSNYIRLKAATKMAWMEWSFDLGMSQKNGSRQVIGLSKMHAWDLLALAEQKKDDADRVPWLVL